MEVTGAQALVRSLESQGVDVVFGLPGGAILPAYDPLRSSTLRHVLVRHEQGAGHAALLVPDQHVPERGGPQRVVGGQDGSAGQAEHDVDPLAFQAADERLGSGHFHGMCSFEVFELCAARIAITKNLLADPAEEE